MYACVYVCVDVYIDKKEGVGCVCVCVSIHRYRYVYIDLKKDRLTDRRWREKSGLSF